MKARTTKATAPVLQPRPIAAERHLKTGKELIVHGKYPEALVAFDKAIKCDPKCLEAYYIKGTVQNSLEEYQDAIHTFNILIALDTDRVFKHKAVSKQGVSWAGLNNYDEAIRAYEASLSIKPTVSAYCHKAAFLYHAGKDSEALECFNLAHLLESSSASSPMSRTIHHSSNVIHSDPMVEIEHTLQAREALRKKFLELQETTRSTQEAVSSLPQDSASIPSAVSEAVSRFKALAHKSKAVTKTVVSALDQPKGQSSNDSKVMALEKKIAEMQSQMIGLVSTLQEAGVYEIARIKQEFAALEQSHLVYCTTFYWSVINLIGAYRHISTDLVEGNAYADTSTKETLLVTGAKKAASVATDFAKGIPFIGCIVSALDNIINTVYEAYKKQQLTNKVDAINIIVQRKFLTEEDVSKNIAKMALTMTKNQKEAIDTEPEEHPHGWLIQEIMDLLNSEDHTKPFAARLALKDVALFMTHLILEYEQIVASHMTFSDQIPHIARTVKGIRIEVMSKKTSEPDDHDGSTSPGYTSLDDTQSRTTTPPPTDPSAEPPLLTTSKAIIATTALDVLPAAVELVGNAIQEKVSCSSFWCC